MNPRFTTPIFPELRRSPILNYGDCDLSSCFFG